MAENTEIDDPLVATIISECMDVMREYPTTTRVTAIYNMLIRNFRLCCVQGDKEDLKTMAKQVYDGLLEEIEKR